MAWYYILTPIGVNFRKAPRLEPYILKSRLSVLLSPLLFCHMQFFVYFESVFHSVTNNKTRRSANAKKTARPLRKYPKPLGASPAKGHAHFSFIMSIGKPQLHANFEVGSLSCCRNIKGKPPNLGSALAQVHVVIFLVGDFMMGLGKPQ